MIQKRITVVSLVSIFSSILILFLTSASVFRRRICILGSASVGQHLCWPLTRSFPSWCLACPRKIYWLFLVRDLSLSGCPGNKIQILLSVFYIRRILEEKFKKKSQRVEYFFNCFGNSILGWQKQKRANYKSIYKNAILNIYGFIWVVLY